MNHHCDAHWFAASERVRFFRLPSGCSALRLPLTKVRSRSKSTHLRCQEKSGENRRRDALAPLPCPWLTPPSCTPFPPVPVEPGSADNTEIELAPLQINVDHLDPNLVAEAVAPSGAPARQPVFGGDEALAIIRQRADVNQAPPSWGLRKTVVVTIFHGVDNGLRCGASLHSAGSWARWKKELQRAIAAGRCCLPLPAGGYRDGRTLRSFHSRLWDTPSIPAMSPVKKRPSDAAASWSPIPLGPEELGVMAIVLPSAGFIAAPGRATRLAAGALELGTTAGHITECGRE
jgi:hypothetical protein